MRSEIGVNPWAKYFLAYCDGVKIEDCTMADEELGCAEVFADVEATDRGTRRRLSPRKRMVFGDIELRPLDVAVAKKIRANPERAQELWDEYYLPMKAEWDRELAASGWPRKPAAGPAPHRRHWLSFDEMMGGLFLRGLE